ncbi:zinc finger protein 335-like [Orussus abietinus]|uniref:zinc finger protein 335-like n=1 Tax=Orussus abietinus TaxID=222816 RepID=UPI000625E834|nr:zinc finger protein 335-like [Orussus abietinus]
MSDRKEQRTRRRHKSRKQKERRNDLKAVKAHNPNTVTLRNDKLVHPETDTITIDYEQEHTVSLKNLSSPSVSGCKSRSLEHQRPSVSLIEYQDNLDTDTSVPYIFITRLAPCEEDTCIGDAIMKPENEGLLLDRSDTNSQSKPQKKLILLRKIDPKNTSLVTPDKTQSIDESSEANTEKIIDTTEFFAENVSALTDDDDLIDSKLWMKRFYPLPLHYTHKGTPYLRCPACAAIFFTCSAFQHHFFSHAYKDTEEYVCVFCNYSNKDPNIIFTHLFTHQNQCEVCNINLTRKNGFQKHWAISSSSFKAKRDCYGRFVCCNCKLVFDLLLHLKKHWFKHSCIKQKAHQCNVCLGLFDNKEVFKNHTCLRCPTCNTTFDSLQRLKAHTSTTKHFLICSICLYEFILTIDHEKHLALHSESYLPHKDYAHCLEAKDGKSFQCELCSKIFYVQSRLVLHIREDHNIDNIGKNDSEEGFDMMLLTKFKEEPITDDISSIVECELKCNDDDADDDTYENELILRSPKEEPLEEDDSDNRYESESLLWDNETSVQTNVKSVRRYMQSNIYECAMCKETFDSAILISEHIWTQHEVSMAQPTSDLEYE